MKDKSNAKSFSLLTSLTITEKIVSFIYQAMIASILGASIITDSYFASSQLITLVEKTFFTGLVIALLNVYSRKITENGRDSAFAFLSDSISLIAVFALGISAFVFIFAWPVSLIIAPGFSDEARRLLVRDIRILSIIPLFSGCFSVFSTILRNERDFFIVGLKSLFLSVAGIVFLVLIALTGSQRTLSLAYGQLIAIVLFVSLSYFNTRKYGTIRLSRLKWNDDQKQVLFLLIPIIISNGISRVSMMIDRIIASNIGEGAVSYITYSHTIYDVVHTLLIANLRIIMLSDFTSLVMEKKNEALKNKLSNTVTLMMYVLSFITVITMFYCRDIVNIIYGRGNFTAQAAEGTSGLLFFYAICYVFSGMNSMYVQVFYAYGKTKQTMYVSLLSMTVNFTSSILLSKFIGLNGIAVGTIIATVMMSCIYTFLIKKNIPGYRVFGKKETLLRVGSIMILCATVSMLIQKLIHSSLLSFVIAVGISGLLCYSVLRILKDQYALMISDLIGKYMRKIIKKKG